jgi:FkbM family methyltransferase
MHNALVEEPGSMLRKLEDFMEPWRASSGLKLTFGNRLKFMAASSRRLARWLSMSGVRVLRVRVSERGRTLTLLLRPNGEDFTVVQELFLKRPYDVLTEGVKTILDLGGNIGLATLLLHSRFPEAAIAVVEPIPQNVSMLNETLNLNGVAATVFEAAVGADDGLVKLFVSAGGNSSSSMPWFDEGLEISVRQMSIPAIMAAMGWNRRVNFIVGEAHAHVQYGIEDLTRDLAPFGFRVTQRSKDSQWGMTVFEALSPGAQAALKAC